jgi:predicted MFS family arabinose efflux permease
MQNKPDPHAASTISTYQPSTWVMLLALCTAFALSQAYRTVAAMMATQLQSDFQLSAQQLGVFAGSFHFAFGAMQFFTGIGIDLHGIRRTILMAFPLAIAGSVLSALANSYALVVLGQVMIGIGCAPAFLVCTVFIARRFPQQRFASVSGLVLGLGGVGMMLTGTPLAWVVQEGSWRLGFVALAIGSAIAWLVMFLLARDPEDTGGGRQESMLDAMRNFAGLFKIPHTWGIFALGAVTYASFMTLRGLWLGPLLVERYGFSLVQSGNVALLVSIMSILGYPLFGWLNPQGRSRRRWIVSLTLVLASLFAVLAVAPTPGIAATVSIVIGFLAGFIVLQYADVRAAYPAALTGRAMAVFTMGMFLGIALMQWITGVVASLAAIAGVDPFTVVLFTIAAMLAAGVIAFAGLPAPAGHAERNW